MTTEALIKINDKFDFLTNRIDILEDRIHDLEVNSTSSSASMLDYVNVENDVVFDVPKNISDHNPSKLNVFDAILMNLENSFHGKKLRYILPRGVGTTTTLVRLSEHLLSQNYSVLHLVNNPRLAQEQNREFGVSFVEAITSKFDSYTPDYIICDNCSSELIPYEAYLEIQSVDY